MKNIIVELTQDELTSVSGGQGKNVCSGTKTVSAVSGFVAAELLVCAVAFFIGIRLSTARVHPRAN
jgi:hypothetical protein